MKSFSLKLRVKINLAILLTFIIIAVIYAAFLFPFEIKRQQTVIEQVKLTLNAIITQRQEQLGDEIFGRQIEAIKITMDELLKVRGIVAIRIYLEDGTLFQSSNGNALEILTQEQLQQLTTEPFFRRRTIAGRATLNFANRIEVIGESVGFIEVDYDLSRVKEEARTSKQMSMVMLAVILLSMFGLLNILLSKMVLKPVYILSETIKKIQQGSLGEQVNLSSHDEMGAMAIAFNKMSSDLAELTQGLEKRVADRTNQLNETNLELEKARAVAESSTEMKSEFLANMSHEIRSPMNAIIGLSHLALKLELTPKLKDYLLKIDSSSKALLGIINDILDFSKIEAGKLHIEKIPFRLEDVLDNLRSMVAMKAEEQGIELIFHTAKGVPNQMVGDPLRLGQVLLNLSTNAIKFTESGHVLIKIEIVEANNEKRAHLRFSVIDTGIGLSEEQISKLFKSFSQADASTTRKYGGTGLGLAICKNIVELMDGSIKVESVEGKGSTFSFSAFFERDENAQSAAPAEFYTDRIAGMKALVVDDNAIAREILVEHLEPFSLEIFQVASGNESIAELENAVLAKHPYQLVLMDWKMAGMDGIETSILIKKNNKIKPSPKIIMITSYGREEIIVRAEKAGIDDYLIKPVEQRLLLKKVGLVLTGETDEPEQVNIGDEDQEGLAGICGAKVLLVEDNEINQQVATEMLNYAGLEVEIANNGLIALDRIISEKAPGYFDIVFMDIQMPVMDGHTATKKIRQSGAPLSEVPIIAMTAHAMESERQKCLDNGMNEHISKPIDPELLLKTLIQWIKPKQREISSHVSEAGTDKFEDDFDLLPSELAGFDLAAGLSRLVGKRKLYHQLLLKFARNHQQSQQQIEQMLQNNRYDEGVNLAHAIKGNAGNLGAEGLHQAAADLEQAFAKGNGIEQAIKPFSHELQAVLKTLSTLQQQADAVQDNEGDEHSKMDIDRVNKELEELAKLISTDYGEALESIGRLKLLVKGSDIASKISELVDYLDAFEEEAAKTGLKEIKLLLNATSQLNSEDRK